MEEFTNIFVGEETVKADSKIIYDIAIIGAGPGGLTAGIYAGRSRLKTLIFERLSPGGQIAVSDQVDNYPGFPEGISGKELTDRMEKQAVRFGAEIVPDEVRKIKKEGNLFELETASSGIVKSKAVIIATGADPVKLPVPEEEKFRGRGISYCATCDAAFFKDKTVAVVGGGDTAIADAIYLTKFAKEVIVVHRRDQLRAVKALQEEAFENPKIKFQWNSVSEHVIGENKVEGLEVKNVKTGEKVLLKVDGIFVAIGTVPNSNIVKGLVELNEKGFIKTNQNRETSVKGLFAVGDVRDTPLRQVVTAAGDGAIAEFSAENYIKNLEYIER
ncbi:MAG: thioredoxin-disulfide reductase [Caldisericaceae bacterium]|nr:thioredoxin-disulfide reductase [Caldisericaceae bacterium]